MGCPQSKNKNISGDNNGGVNDVTNTAARKSRNDAIRPEPEGATRAPIKTAHAYNDDPLVRGRSDDSFAKMDVPEDVDVKQPENNSTNGQIIEQLGPKTSEGKCDEPNENHNDEKRESESINSSEKKTYGESETLAIVDKSKRNDTTVLGQKKVEGNMKSSRKSGEVSFQSVFIADETESESLDGHTNQMDDLADVVDVNDVNISQTVNEITLDNQVIHTGPHQSGKSRGDGSNNTEKRFSAPKSPITDTFKVNTADGQLFKDTNSPWEGSSTVRYVSNNKIEYGIPEGAPKPAPPKTKKSDIITPTTFTVVDKIVDQTPDDAFSSMNKLSSYLSGTKKSQVQSMGDGDDDTDSRDLPPPKPVTTKKKEIITDVSMFKRVDENARNVPESVRLSVDRLAAHLCKVATTDLEKVRAFYYWICNNIRYAYEKEMALSDKLRFDAVSTLRQGQGSYVNLMSGLCKEVGIPVVIIPGCSKGLRNQPDKEFNVAERNHSWNAVYIGNEWRFMDCTWGSGFVDATGKFKQQFDEFWFLTDPEIFAYDHFPSHSVWQLLNEPIEIDEFNKKPSLTERSRELGFRLISHREPIVYFDNEVTVSFATETYPLSNITADLKGESVGEINQYRCMKRIDHKTFQVRVVPPEVGEYTLALYGKARDYRHAKFRKLMEYTLRCESAFADKVVFPDHRKAWGPEPNYKELGFADSIQTLSVFKCDSEEMSIKMEQTKIVPIIAELKAASDYNTELEGYAMITAHENTKEVHIRFPSSGYFRLDVYAEGNLEKYEYAALFLLECTVDKPIKKYPKYNADSLSKHVCEIIEPRDLKLPSNSTVTFSLRSQGLRNAMVGIPSEQDYGSRMKGLGELTKSGDVFSGQIKTPGPGETLLLSGSGAPPNVFWSRIYEYVTKK